MRVDHLRIRLAKGLGLVVAAGLAVGAQTGPRPASSSSAGVPYTTDEYVRYDLARPDTATFRVLFDASVQIPNAKELRDPIRKGTVVSQGAATDLMTGRPLAVSQTPDALVVTLARRVPENGQGRVRIEKSVRSPATYRVENGVGVWSEPLIARRGLVILPAGFEAIGCNLPVQVIAQPDGRVGLAYMAQRPSLQFREPVAAVAPVVESIAVRLRSGAQTGPSAMPAPPTNARSWEGPPAQGPTERTRLGERASQDRDITYFLQDPATNSFSLFHDYTESRPGVSTYVNVVRTGSRVSSPSASILDTGEVLKDEILRGDAITAAKVDTGGPVTADTEVVVVHFDPVKSGQSVRLRIRETYAAPESYRLDGEDLVFDRSLGRPRNSVVLPAGWYLTALSIPGMISEVPDAGRSIRIDFYNGRNDSIDVLIKGRRLTSPSGALRR